MPSGKSSSFKQISPFYPRAGVLSKYESFSIDNLGVNNTKASLAITLQPSDAEAEIVTNPTLSYRRSIGNAEICGLSEYTNPSVPPRKYRRQDLSGSMNACFAYSTNPAYHDAYSGSFIYSSSDCSTNNTQAMSRYLAPSGPCLSIGSPTGTTNPGASGWFDNWGVSQFFNVTLTQIFQGYVGKSNPPIGFVPGMNGAASSQLLDEDTEQDAITRFEIANPQGAWGGSLQKAYYELRTSGFTFAYSWAQFRIQKSGLTPGANVSISVPIILEPYPSGTPFIGYYQNYATTVSGGGTIDFQLDISVNPGFVAYPDDPIIIITP